MWSRDRAELFYRNGARMMSVPLTTDGDLRPGRPEVLFEGRYSYGYLDWAFNYDVSPDGQSFYMVRESEDLEHRLRAVTNWTAEVDRLMASARREGVPSPAGDFDSAWKGRGRKRPRGPGAP